MADEKTPSELFIEERQDTGSRKKAIAAGAGGATSFFLAGMLGGSNSPAADLTILDRAKEMEAAGKDRDYIWKETWKMGQPWFNNRGVWSFEFSTKGTKQIRDVKDLPTHDPDPLARLQDPVVSDYIEIPGLSEAYPGLKKTSLHGIDSPEPRGRTIHGPSGGKTASRIELSKYLNSAEAEEAALHEMQHVIQRKEGMTPGGSVTGSGDRTVWRKQYTNFEEINNAYHKHLFKRIAKDFNFPSYEEYKTGEIQTRKDAGQFIPDTWSRGQEQAWQSEYRTLTLKLHKEATSPDTLEKNDRLSFLKREALLDTYKHFLGEADARNASYRGNFSHQEIGDKPYWETYDVPEEDLLIPSPRGVTQSEDLSQKRLPPGVSPSSAATIARVAKKKILPIFLFAEHIWKNLSEDQQAKFKEIMLDKPMHELVGMSKPGIEYVRELIGMGTEEEEVVEDTDYTVQTDLFGPEHSIEVGGGIDPSSPIVDLILAGAKQGHDPKVFIEKLISDGLVPEYARDQAYDYFERATPVTKAHGGFIDKPLYERTL